MQQMTLISTTIKLVKITPLITELAYRFPIIVVHQRVAAHARDCVCAIHDLVFCFFFFLFGTTLTTFISNSLSLFHNNSFSRIFPYGQAKHGEYAKQEETIPDVRGGGGGEGGGRRWLGLFCQTVNFPQQIWKPSRFLI